MPLQLTVENHLSFREPVTLSMLAPEGASGPTVREGERRTLTTAAIYGANATAPPARSPCRTSTRPGS